MYICTYAHRRCRLSCDPYPSLQHVAATLARFPASVAHVACCAYTVSEPHSVWRPFHTFVKVAKAVNVLGFWHMSGPLTPHLDMLRSMPNSKRQRHIASSQPMKVNIFLPADWVCKQDSACPSVRVRYACSELRHANGARNTHIFLKVGSAH